MADRERRMEDHPPNSRLFVIHGKTVENRDLTEDTFKEAFGKYGTVEDVWILKARGNKTTGQLKGVTYVKMSKASEAALVMEKLNKKRIGEHQSPLKILLASKRSQGAAKEINEDQKMLRLFIKVPKDVKEDSVRKDFEEFGSVEDVNIVFDKKTREPKGLAFVTFKTPYQCALAIEQCSKDYKAKFAEPRGTDAARREEHDGRGWREGRNIDRGGRRFQGFGGDRYLPESDSYYDPHYDNIDGFGGGYGDGFGSGGFERRRESFGDRPSRLMDIGVPAPMDVVQRPAAGPMDIVQRSDMGFNSSYSTRLQVMVSRSVTQLQLSALFKVAPGFEYLDLNQETGFGVAKYSNSACASWAKEHLDGLEYPPGFKMMVRYYYGEFDRDMSGAEPRSSISADDIQKATSILRDAGINVPVDMLNRNTSAIQPRYCSFPLPEKQPMAPFDSKCVQRLFIVCQPDAVPVYVLEDCFCRFGNLIEIYLIPGKNFGFARYATSDSAERAKNSLHLKEIAGVRIKVIDAEPEGGSGRDDEGPTRKRGRMEGMEY